MGSKCPSHTKKKLILMYSQWIKINILICLFNPKRCSMCLIRPPSPDSSILKITLGFAPRHFS